jgi:Flp pilus assembly protein TadG
VLLLLIFAIAEIGRAFVQYSLLTDSVRNSARYVAGQALNGSTGVVSISTQLQTQGQNLVAYGSIVASQAVLPGLAPNQVTVANAGGGNISVTAVYPYSSVLGATLPTFGLSDTPISLVFNLTAAATLRALP